MMKSITARALSFSLAIVTCLTLLSRATESVVFFFLLYPGAALSLLITGGHGGTLSEERAGLVVGFLVNRFVYAALFAALLALHSRAREKKGTFL